ncbi:AAA family ATPase [Streptomyces sp. NPDC046831]|uniref:AAA family ATPase n=1 Tax=Streptomyces sp. NPDC046831 TaxID=3154805 RepID=UPI0033FBA307
MFVDRVEHLQALEGFLHQVAQGKGGVFVIQGEQGIGKSALLKEAVRRTQARPEVADCRIVQVRCLSWIGADNAYGPVIDVLMTLQRPRRSVFRLFGRSAVQAVPELVSLVPALGPLLKAAAQITQTALDSGSAQGDSLMPYRQSVARTVATALADAAARGGPTAVFIDDAQWLDPSSLLVLEHLVELLERGGPAIGLILGHRSDPEPEPGIVTDVLARWEIQGSLTRHQLGGLPEHAVTDLVRHLAGPVAASVPARLIELTKGHPVFVTQCLRLIGPDGVLRGPLPETVEPLVRGRLARLDPATMELLVIGATQGETFETGVVARVAGEPTDEVVRRLHELSRRHGLIVAVPAPDWALDGLSDHYRFENALLQMAVSAEQSPAQARKRHHLIANALAGSTNGSGTGALPLPVRLDIARHYSLARQWDDAEREQFALARALAVGGLSFSEAEALCRQGVESARRLPSTADDRDGRLARGIELLLSLTEVRWQGRSATGGGESLDALAREAEEAGRRSGDLPLIARTALLHGKCLLRTQGLQPALGKLEEAVGLAQDCNDPPALYVALAEYGSQLPKRDLAAGLRVLRQAEELYERAGLHSSGDPVVGHVRNLAEMQLGVSLFDAGHLVTARDRLTGCLQRLRTEPVHAELPVGLNYLAQVQRAMGSESEARDSLEEALAFEEARGGASGWHANNAALLALLLSGEPGERDRCRAMVEAAWQEAQRTWLLDLVPIVRNLYAEVVLNLAGGDPAELAVADRLAEETVGETSQTGMVRSGVAALILRSRIHLGLADAAAAAGFAREAVAVLDRVGDMPALRTEEVLHHASLALRAAHSPEEADALALRARTEVLRKAELMTCPVDRNRFLRGVVLNRTILGTPAPLGSVRDHPQW